MTTITKLSIFKGFQRQSTFKIKSRNDKNSSVSKPDDHIFILCNGYHIMRLRGFDAETVEIVVGPNAQITRKPLPKPDLSDDDKITVGAVFRDGEWRIAVDDALINNR
jgi:hypothetical protein